MWLSPQHTSNFLLPHSTWGLTELWEGGSAASTGPLLPVPWHLKSYVQKYVGKPHGCYSSHPASSFICCFWRGSAMWKWEPACPRTQSSLLDLPPPQRHWLPAARKSVLSDFQEQSQARAVLSILLQLETQPRGLSTDITIRIWPGLRGLHPQTHLLHRRIFNQTQTELQSQCSDN